MSALENFFSVGYVVVVSYATSVVVVSLIAFMVPNIGRGLRLAQKLRKSRMEQSH